MARGVMHAWALLVSRVGSAGARPSGSIGWPEAVSRLAEERSKAELCVASLKRYGNSEQVSHGQLTYGSAKAEFDGVIAGLVIALGEGGNPGSLLSLDAKLADGAKGLEQFCKSVSDLVPKAPGKRASLTPW